MFVYFVTLNANYYLPISCLARVTLFFSWLQDAIYILFWDNDDDGEIELLQSANEPSL